MIIVAVYWRVLGNQFVNFDDGLYIYLNNHVKSGLTWDGILWALTSVSYVYWQPLTWLSHMLDVEWFGMNPGGHHFVSLLIHVANAAVLLTALWRLTGSVWRSAFTTALWALHPLRVESVAWAAERKDVLSALFYLAAIWAYWRYCTRPSRSRYALVAGLLALGLMAKPTVVSAPFLLLILDWWPLRRKEDPRRLLLEKLPLVALSAVASLVTFLGQREAGAMVAVENLAFPERLANALLAYVRYLGLLFWPHPLAVLYPYRRDWPWWTVAGACLLLAGVSYLAWSQRRRAPYFLAGWLWFVVALIPMIGLIQVGPQAYADRFSYLASVGITVAVVWGAADFAGERGRLAAAALGIAVLAVLSYTTWEQLAYWRDSVTLFQHAVDVTTGNALAQHNLGFGLMEQGRNAEAVPHLEEAMRLQPRYYQGHYNLGKALAAEGKNMPAIESFSAALRLKPDYADAYYARAVMWHKSGNALAAEKDYRAALQADLAMPYEAEACNGLGVLLAQRGDLAAAITQFEAAVKLRPGFTEAQRNLTLARTQQGQTAPGSRAPR